MNSLTPLIVPVGEYRVSADPDAILFTCVGSCIAVALHDPGVKMAGLLHIVLPGRRNVPRVDDRIAFYADTGIPLLLKVMEQHGAERSRMSAIIAGGACLAEDSDPAIGRSNIETTLALLTRAGIHVLRQETGGREGRVLELAVATGSAMIKTNPRSAPLVVTDSTEAVLPDSQLSSLAELLERMRPDPLVAGKLFDVLHEPEIVWDEVFPLICRDMPLAVHFFRKCNADYFGVPQSVGSFAAALSLLGSDKLRRVCVVIAAEKNSITRLADFGVDQAALSRHCQASAIAAHHLAQRLLPGQEDEAFTAALFHPLGCVAAHLERLDGLSSTSEADVCSNCCSYPSASEPENYRHRQQLGRSVLAQWKFPLELVNAASAERAAPCLPVRITLAAAVEAGCTISTMLGFTFSRFPQSAGTTLSALERITTVFDDELLFPEIIQKLRAVGLML